MSRTLTALFREPLLQFLAIGAVLFALDHYFTLQRDDPHQIIVGPDQVSELVNVFFQGQGRLPEQEEIDNLIVKWSQNEIFYREARAMGLDQGDEMMRNRLVLKMRNVIFNRVVEQPPEDGELQQWFELNRANYDIPERYSLELLTPEGTTDAAAADAMAASYNGPGAAQPAESHHYSRRSADNLASMFDDASRDTLLAAPAGQWVAIAPEDKWLLARVVEVHPAVPAEFETVKTQVARDFKKAASGMQVSDMATEIADKYQLHLEFDDGDIREILANTTTYDVGPVTAQSRSLKARAGVTNAGNDS
ncbi:peptidyl-prolyl cis-trans isomerase [Mangrovimicrobium sediminis]|uniref:Peptidyl-prolyl cis-trans isomerase n=1 Tax=Mangrovimicrobium sediminis TaxID=2562682 RepID=A0A4Z0LUI0_9GAMM|nr:peptidylprolyl isomerase [Haliea sp. SAOS-164]TGD70941.1 peptidyl-prolyl cis-trans isomerase [Haliea sp. SAOS-164]